MDKHRFSGVKKLVDISSYDRISRSHVLVVGLGGVGSWTAEALVRSGVGNITLVDPDSVCVTNINRQLIALNSTVGQSKVSVMKNRLTDINPECNVNIIEDFFCDETKDEIFNISYDFAFDGIDRLKNKLLFIFCCQEKRIPFLISGGAGGKIDATRVQISDLGDSYRDRLLFIVRKRLRQNFKYPKGKKNMNIPCIFSPEETRFFTNEGKLTNSKQGLGVTKLDCHGSVGSFAPTTGVFGLMSAGYIIKQLIKKD